MYLNCVEHTNCIGQICDSINFGKFEIINYEHPKGFDIRFLNTGYVKNVKLGEVSRFDNIFYKYKVSEFLDMYELKDKSNSQFKCEIDI